MMNPEEQTSGDLDESLHLADPFESIDPDLTTDQPPTNTPGSGSPLAASVTVPLTAPTPPPDNFGM